MGRRAAAHFAVAVACAALPAVPAAGAARLAAAPTPPVIKELFTPLPCPASPQTTLDMEGCAEKQILATDRQIDALVAAAWRQLDSAGPRASLARGERAWRTYRDASCDALYKVYDGGTQAPVAFGTCIVARNRSHLTDLAALLKALKPQG